MADEQTMLAVKQSTRERVNMTQARLQIKEGAKRTHDNIVNEALDLLDAKHKFNQ